VAFSKELDLDVSGTMTNSLSILVRFPGLLLGRLSEITLQFVMKRVIPISWHFAIRDSGMFRSIADYGAFIIGLSMTLFRPRLPFDLIKTRNLMKFFSYADTYGKVHSLSNATPTPPEKKVLQQSHMLEVIELPNSNIDASNDIMKNVITEQPIEQPVRPILVFVHGGAWGSGRTWQYTLIAQNLGKLINASHVVLVGYPYYPNATILEQRDSILASIYHIQNSPELGAALGCNNSTTHADIPSSSVLSNNPYGSFKIGSQYRPVVLAGHSSGANLIALALFHHYHEAEQFHGRPQGFCLDDKFVDMVIGLSGVYDIEKHYDYESGRGVQHLSPMGAAAISKDVFWRCSPTLLIQKRLRDNTAYSKEYMQQHHHFPHVAVIHGDEDDVVPHISTLEYERAMQAFGISIDSYYPKVRFFCHFRGLKIKFRLTPQYC
jgi:acetyl esterase/lipase